MTAISINTPQLAGPRAELTDVTPEMATEWLAHNKRNRHLRETKVRTYASAMDADDWMVTGDGPKFTPDGRLINGQHTLEAVVASGKTVRMFVFYNMPDESQLVMDMGAKRTVADALKFAGVSGCSLVVLAAAARVGILWEEGFFKHSGQSGSAREVTSLETIEWVEQNPDAISAVSNADLLRKSLPIPSSALAFANMTLSRIDAAKTAHFFSLAASFQTSGKGDPIYTMLRRYQNAAASGEKFRTPQHLFLIFRTWNAWVQREPLFQLKMGTVTTTAGGISPITIPTPKAAVAS